MFFKDKNLRFLFWIIFIIISLLILKFLFFSEKPIEVKAYKVKRGTIEEIVTNTRAGTLKARKRSKLSPRTSGTVVFLPKKKGDFVKKGELILKLDDSIQKASLETAEKNRDTLEAKLKEIEVSLNLAIKEEKRALNLYLDKVISEEIYDKAKAEKERLEASLNSTKALLKQAEAEVNLAKENFKLTELYAPFDGYISEVYTEIGEWIAPSFPGIALPPIIEIIDLTEMYVSAPIDEMDSKKVNLGNEVRITIDSYPDKTFKGTLTKIGVYVQDIMEQNRTVEVEVNLEWDGFSALPGTSADIEIITTKKENVLIIPTSSIAKEDNVFCIENGKLLLKKIKIGLQNFSSTEVIDGLKEGEIIISSIENIDLKEGKKVKPINYD